jgi:hypothetical protein
MQSLIEDLKLVILYEKIKYLEQKNVKKYQILQKAPFMRLT